ncbi:hypothetical protein [Modestobacter lacusdianchii]
MTTDDTVNRTPRRPGTSPDPALPDPAGRMGVDGLRAPQLQRLTDRRERR